MDHQPLPFLSDLRTARGLQSLATASPVIRGTTFKRLTIIVASSVRTLRAVFCISSNTARLNSYSLGSVLNSTSTTKVLTHAEPSQAHSNQVRVTPSILSIR